MLEKTEKDQWSPTGDRRMGREYSSISSLQPVSLALGNWAERKTKKKPGRPGPHKWADRSESPTWCFPAHPCRRDVETGYPHHFTFCQGAWKHVGSNSWGWPEGELSWSCNGEKGSKDFTWIQRTDSKGLRAAPSVGEKSSLEKRVELRQAKHDKIMPGKAW